MAKHGSETPPVRVIVTCVSYRRRVVRIKHRRAITEQVAPLTLNDLPTTGVSDALPIGRVHDAGVWVLAMQVFPTAPVANSKPVL